MRTRDPRFGRVVRLVARRAAVVAALASLASEVATAQVTAESVADSARALLGARGVPGGQVVVLRDGAPIVDVAYGLAHVDSQRPVTSATRFRVGSISKLFTATAAAQLWDQGSFDLDVQITQYLPELTLADGGVTARRLGGHLGGVRHYIGRDFAAPPGRFDDVVDALRIFATDSLVAVPGTRYFYSSYGYNALGAAIQRAAGEEFRRYLAHTVFVPFGMAATVAERSDSAIADLAQGYTAAAGSWRQAPRTDLSDRWPSGGFLAPAADIARFAEQSVRGPLLSARARALLFTPMTLPDGSSTGVGFGWRVGEDTDGRSLYHHGGASVGGRAMLVVWRDTALVVAITTNLSGAPVTEADAFALGRYALQIP